MGRIFHFVLTFFAIGVAGYAVFVYGFLPLGKIVHPDIRAVFTTYPIGIYAHIFASAVALAIGPFQFLPGLRQKHLPLHKLIGRTYITSVVIGGCAGLFMAFHAFGGVPPKTGFGLLAIIWLGSAGMALHAVLLGDITKHREWMLRNYALTFAAVNLRLYLPSAMQLGFDFTIAYGVIAWMCWVPNLLIAQWYVIYSRNNHLLAPRLNPS